MPVTQEEIDAFNAPPPGINIVDEVALTGGDNTPSGPPSGPGITADDAFANDGPSNGEGPAPAPADISDRGRGQNDGGGNGSSGGGGTHVCTASYANNLITILDFKSLKKYGIKLRRNDKYLMKAYDWFGPKLAKHTQHLSLIHI